VAICYFVSFAASPTLIILVLNVFLLLLIS
jgi:hypothetical protein